MELPKKLERRDATSESRSLQIIGSTTFQLGKELKYNLMEATKFVWQRPNDLNHPRAYFEISLDNESLLMNPSTPRLRWSRKTSRAVKLTRIQDSQPRFGKQVRMEALCRPLRAKLLAAMEGNFTTKGSSHGFNPLFSIRWELMSTG